MKLVKSKCNTLMATSEVLHESNVIYMAPNHKRTSVRTTPVRQTACSTGWYGSEHLPALPRTDVEGLRREQLIGADLGSRRAVVCTDRFRRRRNSLNTTNLIRAAENEIIHLYSSHLSLADPPLSGEQDGHDLEKKTCCPQSPPQVDNNN